MRNTIWIAKDETIDEFMERTQLMSCGMDSFWYGVSKDGCEWKPKKIDVNFAQEVENIAHEGDERILARLAAKNLVEGKWIGRCRSSRVREWFEVLSIEVRKGRLGPAFEMTKVDKNNNFNTGWGEVGEEFLVGIYTRDFTDTDDVKRVLYNAEAALAGYEATFDRYKPIAITQLEAMNEGLKLRIFAYTRQEIHQEIHLDEMVENIMDEPPDICLPAPTDLFHHVETANLPKCVYTVYKVPCDVPSKAVLCHFKELHPVFLVRQIRSQHYNGAGYHNIVFECIRDCAMETFFPAESPRYKVTPSDPVKCRKSKVLRASIPACNVHIGAEHIQHIQEHVTSQAGYPILIRSYRLDPSWKMNRCHTLQLQFHSVKEVQTIVSKMLLDGAPLKGTVPPLLVYGVQPDSKPCIYSGSTPFRS